jgi:ABC-type transport system involved in cytochrome c biogenesis permease subunit
MDFLKQLVFSILIIFYFLPDFKELKLGANMKLFNAIQLITLFGAFPFLLNWLTTNPFPYSNVAFWLALIAYLVLYVWIIVIVYENFSRKD